MKTIYEHAIGGDGASASLVVDDAAMLVLAYKHPVAGLLDPVNKIIDDGVAKIEALIPGDWDKAILDPIAAGLKAEILALLTK